MAYTVRPLALCTCNFRAMLLPPSDNPYVWPASRHAWALNEVQRFFIEETRLGIPTDFTNEGIRGVESYIATNFPTQLGLGHTWNRNLVHKVGYITGREGRLLGYTNVYAPILDVGRDQRWGRYEEVYGESPYLVAELGVEMAKGMQTDYQVAATSKHYIAYSNNKGAREGMARVDPQMSPREVENIHIYPFKRVIREAGMLGVMSSYNDYDGILHAAYAFVGKVYGDAETGIFHKEPLHLVQCPGVARGGPDVGIVRGRQPPLLEAVQVFVDGADTVFPEQLFPFGGGEVVFQYAFVAVEGDHLAGLFVQRHLLQQVFDACFERGGGVFVHVFHSVFVEVYPTFAVHFTFHRLVGCRCFGRLLCAEQCASSKQQG